MNKSLKKSKNKSSNNSNNKTKFKKISFTNMLDAVDRKKVKLRNSLYTDDYKLSYL